MRQDMGVPAGRLLVGTLGRIDPAKGPEFFLDVVERLSSRVPDLDFVWAGDGPLRSRIERAAQERRLRLRFIGLVSPERVPAALAAMDLVLMTSMWEGLPRVAVQATLCARPVIAFDAPGTREVILEGINGHVVARGDVDAMVAAAERVLRRPDRGRALGEAGRGRFADEFRWERMVEKLDGLYAEIISRKGIACTS
jgi:glycosyltransferase involved in cell wall biosynthesis